MTREEENALEEGDTTYFKTGIIIIKPIPVLS
jgi:hypothetical protein